MGAVPSRLLRELDLVALDERVGEELLAHPLELGAYRGRVVARELEIDDPAHARLGNGTVGREHARDELERMCEQLLANPLIESFEISLDE